MIGDIGVSDIVRHFKGKYYQIIAFGEYTESREKEVVYQALYPPFKVWVRPYDQFMSKVDHEKYPDIKQKYRFEPVTEVELANLTRKTNREEKTLNDLLYSLSEMQECITFLEDE